STAPSPSRPAPRTRPSCRYARPKPQNRPARRRPPCRRPAPRQGSLITAERMQRGAGLPVPLLFSPRRAVKMRLYLSSDRIGDRVGALLALVGFGARAAIIPNALDGVSPTARE